MPLPKITAPDATQFAASTRSDGIALPASSLFTSDPTTGVATEIGSSNPLPVTLPAGANLIGKVGIDQTTPGTTNKVSIGTDGTVDASGTKVTAASIPAGGVGFLGWLSAIFWQLTQAIPAGANAIGSVDATGTKVTAATIPTGGVGFLGWLSAIWWQLTQNLSVNGTIVIASGSVTRPANTTAYTANTIIANSVTAGSCTPISLTVARGNDRSFMIRKVRLRVNDTAWLSAVVRVHLYRNSPTFANGDNAAWASGTTESDHIGYADVLLDRQFSDPFVKGHGVPVIGSEFNGIPTSGAQTIFAVLETRSALTPASARVFTLDLEVHQN